LAYCPALQMLSLDDTQVSDLAPLAALISNGLEITGVDPAL
jgi:Leucine-rich repeat (LRR) protein